MKILEFRKLRYSDEHDLKSFNDGACWSRIYEYPFVLKSIKKYNEWLNKKNQDVLIHNTSWGWQGVHVTFKDKLQEIYPRSLHSDIKPSNLPHTTVYDITSEPSEEHDEHYDFVINVSKVEEINPFLHVASIKNLLAQVKKGGFLILTFDISDTVYGGTINLNAVENFLEQKIEDFGEDNLDSDNSALPNKDCRGLNCGILIVEKE